MRAYRLFYVVGSLEAGGLERQLCYLLSSLDNERYQPGVAVWDMPAETAHSALLREKGVAIYTIPRGGGFALRTLRLRALVQDAAPEVVHSYSFFTNAAAWLAAKGTGGLVVGSVRNDYRAELKSVGFPGGMLCAGLPRLLIANSRAAAETARRDSRRVAYVPNAIDLQAFPNAPLPSFDRFEILGIGRLYPQKCWADALLALHKLKSETRTPWRFRLCGEGPLRTSLERQICELGLEAHVELLGHRADVAELLASCHVLLLTSRHEGTPNAVLEAMATGRPVAATAVGDVPDLVADGLDGCVVAPGKTEAMAAALLRLMGDPALVRRLGMSGRKKAETIGGPHELMLRTFDAYREAGWKG